MTEDQLVSLFSGIHSRSPRQVNASWESDAEIVEALDHFLLFSTDSFSEREDFFSQTPPERIGRNMAWSVLADTLVCGISPRFLLSSWGSEAGQDPEWLSDVSRGIESTLAHFGVSLLGGDLGSSANWHWTGTVFGWSSELPVMRKAQNREPFRLCVTGTLGDANAAAFMGGPQPEFEWREPVPLQALMASDTSGGFLDALENLRRVNPELSLTVELEKIPFAVDLPQIPQEFQLIGGVGEYEFVFALPENVPLPKDARVVGFGDFSGDRIQAAGNAGQTAEIGVRFTRNGKPAGRMRTAPPDYRSVRQEEYFAVTQAYFQETFCPTETLSSD